MLHHRWIFECSSDNLPPDLFVVFCFKRAIAPHGVRGATLQRCCWMMYRTSAGGSQTLHWPCVCGFFSACRQMQRYHGESFWHEIFLWVFVGRHFLFTRCNISMLTYQRCLVFDYALLWAGATQCKCPEWTEYCPFVCIATLRASSSCGTYVNLLYRASHRAYL